MEILILHGGGVNIPCSLTREFRARALDKKLSLLGNVLPFNVRLFSAKFGFSRVPMQISDAVWETQKILVYFITYS